MVFAKDEILKVLNEDDKMAAGGYMADGGETIGFTMYYEPQKNLGGKSVDVIAEALAERGFELAQ